MSLKLPKSAKRLLRSISPHPRLALQMRNGGQPRRRADGNAEKERKEGRRAR